jgi:hypothetical protein
MSEPFSKTVTRSTLWGGALAVGFFFVFPRHGSALSDFVDAFSLAFCFTFLGHYTDRLLLALPGITTGIGPLVRAAGWFAGGLWSYVVGRWLWLRYGRDLSELPGVIWGGVFLVVLEFVMTRLTPRRGGTVPE